MKSLDQQTSVSRSVHVDYRRALRNRCADFVHQVYRVTKTFPREELYSTTSQLRRAALSIPLNYFEGYARQRIAVQRNFLEIAYGSAKETEFLLEFVRDEGYIAHEQADKLLKEIDEIGAMLYSEIRKIKTSDGI